MTTSTGLDIAAFLDAEHLPVFERIPPRDLDADDIPGTVATIRAAGAARRVDVARILHGFTSSWLRGSIA